MKSMAIVGVTSLISLTHPTSIIQVNKLHYSKSGEKKGKTSRRAENYFLNQVVNMFLNAVKFVNLTQESMGTDFLLESASSGQWRNCSFCHFDLSLFFSSGGLQEVIFTEENGRMGGWN